MPFPETIHCGIPLDVTIYTLIKKVREIVTSLHQLSLLSGVIVYHERQN